MKKNDFDIFIISKSIQFFMQNFSINLKKIVQSGRLDGSPVSTIDLVSGMYWLTIEMPNTRPQTTKIVIAR